MRLTPREGGRCTYAAATLLHELLHATHRSGSAPPLGCVARTNCGFPVQGAEVGETQSSAAFLTSAMTFGRAQRSAGKATGCLRVPSFWWPP